MSPDEVRAIVAELPHDERCDPACPGWAVFNGNEIQRCDDCHRARKARSRFLLDDWDFESLPEAQTALTKESGDALRCRYADCEDDHPVADGRGSVRVTCPTCRSTLGLPPLAPEDVPPPAPFTVTVAGTIQVQAQVEVEAASADEARDKVRLMIEDNGLSCLAWTDCNGLDVGTPDDEDSIAITTDDFE